MTAWLHELEDKIDAMKPAPAPAPVSAQPDVPLVLGHPATASWCAAVDAHHEGTEDYLWHFCRIAGQESAPPGDVDGALRKLAALVLWDRQWDVLRERIQSYFGNSGLFNPEMMEHDKVRQLLMDIRDQIDPRP
jgi:hypothetical protein